MEAKAKEKTVLLEGEISKRLTSRFLRFVIAVTGISFIRAIVLFFATYILGFRRKGRISAEGSLLKIEIESFIIGRSVRKSHVHIPFRNIIFVREDESIGALPVLGAALGLMAGFAIGFIFLVQWSMTLLGIYVIIGFGCVLAGICIDVLVSFVIPRLKGKSSLVFSTEREVYRMRGVSRDKVTSFMNRWSDLLKR